MIKVIHLVRDPRAILNSRKNGNWKSRLQDTEYVCNNLLDDLQLSTLLPSERYFFLFDAKFYVDQFNISLVFRYKLVRYEDVVADPLEMMKDLYTFSGIPFSKEVETNILQRTHAEAANKNSKNYYGTTRSKDFDPNHWKQEMKNNRILEIEDACKDFLDSMNYPSFFVKK